MTVKDDLDALRERWAELGVPRDACRQLMSVLCRHIGRERPRARRYRTPNEGEWCELCGTPVDSHDKVKPGCEGRFGRQDTARGKPEPGSDG